MRLFLGGLSSATEVVLLFKLGENEGYFVANFNAFCPADNMRLNKVVICFAVALCLHRGDARRASLHAPPQLRFC